HHAFPANYLPDVYTSASDDRGSSSRWGIPSSQRYEEQQGNGMAEYTWAGEGDGGWRGDEGGYDYGHFSGGRESHETGGGGDESYEYSAAGSDAFQPRQYYEQYESYQQQ
ncbi:unnamed protein product, partial [Pylaiella littoralis]